MRTRESMEEIFMLTARYDSGCYQRSANSYADSVLEELNAEIRKHIGIIFKITDCIGATVKFENAYLYSVPGSHVQLYYLCVTERRNVPYGILSPYNRLCGDPYFL